MGNSCTPGKLLKNSTISTHSNPFQKKPTQRTDPISKDILQSNFITPPPNLFLAATLPSTKRDKFIRSEEGIESIASRLIDEDFNEFLLKEKNITNILAEITVFSSETLIFLNKELVIKFKQIYMSSLKKVDEKIHQNLSKIFSIFLKICQTLPSDEKFKDFNKSFICFLITIHHIFKNCPRFDSFHQSYFHKNCSRPVSHDKMFLEEKCYIYMKDIMQLPYWISRSIVNDIVDKVRKTCDFTERIMQTLRDDEQFVDTWETDFINVFGRENDHKAAQSRQYLLKAKGFFNNNK